MPRKNKILIRTGSGAPSAADFVTSEPAWDSTNGVLYLKLADGTMVRIGPYSSASLITSGTLDIARIPTGSSSSTVCIGNDSRLSDARTPTGHTHGNITNAGAIGSTADKVAVTSTDGVLTTATIGTGLSLSGGTLSATGGGGGGGGSSGSSSYASQLLFG